MENNGVTVSKLPSSRTLPQKLCGRESVIEVAEYSRVAYSIQARVVTDE